MSALLGPYMAGDKWLFFSSFFFFLSFTLATSDIPELFLLLYLLWFWRISEAAACSAEVKSILKVSFWLS